MGRRSRAGLALLLGLSLGTSCVRRPADTLSTVLPSQAPSGGPSDAGADAGAPEPLDGGEAGTPPAIGPPPQETWAKRLEWSGGEPWVTVRLMEGHPSVVFSSRGRLRLALAGEVAKTVEGPAGAGWTVRVVEGRPAQRAVRVVLMELRFSEAERLAREVSTWEGRGFKVRVHTLGSQVELSGKAIDNRRVLVLLDEELDADAANERLALILRRHGVRGSLFEELLQPAEGILELLDGQGAPVALAASTVDVESADGAPIDVRQVEFGVGYDFHGFEDRSYRGALRLSLDRTGALAVVNRISVEQLLQGLVPSEIFSRAHPEALKAQSVTARGEVLAKVGLKHLADPYLLCAEQHCAVYRGLSGEAPSTNAAVEETRGEALVSAQGQLVDSVYSAVCGGHTENNDAVWGGPADPHLRGRPDALPATSLPPPGRQLEKFLHAELPSACRLSSFAQPTKYRWERRFSAEELNALTAHLGIGPIHAMSVVSRGVSGRVRLLTLSGELGATQMRGELNIRRLFGMLNSAMFTLRQERDRRGRPAAWIFQGGGWGHGVGMCQTGAIGRAEAGQDYHAILDHYFSGAQVDRLY